jgi:hypothetical protein
MQMFWELEEHGVCLFCTHNRRTGDARMATIMLLRMLLESSEWLVESIYFKQPAATLIHTLLLL